MPCPDGSIDPDLVFKERSGGAYAQDFVIRVLVYGILEHRNDVLRSVWDKKFEITNGILNRYLV